MKPYLLIPSAVLLALAACGERAPAPGTALAPAAVTQPEASPVGFHGFGPAHFGTDEESVRMAWGRPLRHSGGETSCAYLLIDPHPAEGFGIAFMLVDGRFARYDVDTPRYVAPGGGKVGSSIDQLERLYGPRLQSRPHKYTADARELVVTPDQGGEARLVFETDANGRVTDWRIGVPPGVHYVEGCS